MNYTLLCDFYELTMGNGYFQTEGYADQICYFDVFFRNVPDGGGFAIAAGLEQVISYIENLRFTEEDITYLRGKGCFCEEFLNYLRGFRFTGDIWAVPEGTPIFPREPILTVRAPAIEAQFIVTSLLLTLNHQPLIATKTNRIARAADGLQWFSRRGAEGSGAQPGSRARAWDLTVDAGCIYAAFLQAYGIDLVRVPFLHWWAFLDLLENLPEHTLMAQKMQLRTMNLSEIKDAKLRERYKKLQRQAALPPRRGRKDNAAETLAQRVQRRHAEAKQQLERRKANGV